VHAHSGAAELGPYRHYMQKEIFEQPRAIADTLEGVEGIVPELFEAANNHAPGENAHNVFQAIDNMLILACGTSYYSGCAAKYWLESIAKVPTQVEIASEYRYRESVPNPRTLVVTITQSGETADTLAALRHAQSQGMTAHPDHLQRERRRPWCASANWPTSPAPGWRLGWPLPRPSPPSWRGLFLLTLALGQSQRALVRSGPRGRASSRPCATCPPRCRRCLR
jgi:glucosamine--fructose-6-phosphate aminotransferase (isomerizing)